MVLDTNVISELIRRTPDPRVLAWLDTFDWDDCLITAITAAELRAGVAMLPAGRRRRELNDEIEHLLQAGFEHRILPFDDAATFHFADLRSSRERRGRPVGFADAQIAAIGPGPTSA